MKTWLGTGLKTGLAALAILAPFVASAAAPPAPIAVTATVRADTPGPVINRYMFGQFAEFVGQGITDGIWVGENSAIPNTRGFRNDVVAALKELHVPLVRWPGGCYADIYHWRDGIGPRDKRPKRINVYWGAGVETNAVGTHEFFDFLDMIGADAYINGNMGSESPSDMADWVEYMTGDRPSSLVEERQRNGRDKPFKVAMFGLGNETWACGGNMRAEYSADVHRRYATFINTPPYASLFDPKPEKPMQKVASGGNGDDYNFTRVMMANAERFMDAITLHYYTTPTGVFGNFGAATGFPEAEWGSTLRNALRIDELVTKHSAVMDEFDPKKRVGLYVDEWGTWYDPTPGRVPGFLFQQNTIRDAVVAALYLNIMQRHADRVRMSSIAQMVNVLQAMILTDGPRMTRTPTYFLYRMYVPFQDATLIPVEASSATFRSGDITLPAIDLLAARGKDGKIRISAVNLDPNRPARITVTLTGARASSAKGEVLTADTTDAHNDFGVAEKVRPVAMRGRIAGGKVVLDLPAKSITVVEVAE